MNIHEFHDLGCRHVVWELPDDGWDSIPQAIDQFLCAAIKDIVRAYLDTPIEWLELNGWSILQRLIVFPSRSGPPSDRDERVCYELRIEHLEKLANQVYKEQSEETSGTAWDALARRVWSVVSDCLRRGKAADELQQARRTSPMRLAGYDYEPGENLWRIGEDGTML